MSMNRWNRRVSVWVLALLLSLSGLLTACEIPRVSAEERSLLKVSLEFLDEYQLPKTEFENTPVGGLSAITYDRQRNLFYALSDDRSERAPARFYTLAMNLSGSKTSPPQIAQIQPKAVTVITDENGQPYARGGVDPEGIALSPLGTVFISSEGVATKKIAPFVREFDLKSGQWKRSLVIPERYIPTFVDGKQTQGVGDNLGFEALTLNISGGSLGAIEPFRLFTATESALVQDADPEHPQQGAARNRLLHYSITPTRTLLVSEHLYPMDPPPEGALFHGLTDILALDQGGHFLSLERSFGLNGFSVKLFQLSMGGATDTSAIAQFQGSLPGASPIRKRLLLDLTQLGIQLDNLEGMTLGPRLPDGSASLLLVSDDNFSARQVSQFLLFRIRGVG